MRNEEKSFDRSDRNERSERKPSTFNKDGARPAKFDRNSKRPASFDKSSVKPAVRRTKHIHHDIKNPIVYIGNLSYKRDSFGIMKLFKPFGYVVKVNLIQDDKEERSKGIAFVEMQTIKAAKDAVIALDGRVLDGRTAKVSIASERFHPEHQNLKDEEEPLSKGEKKAKANKEKNSKVGLQALFSNKKSK
ncbi:hypothetical protein A9Q84_11130 [Halobacteriovorax marinus]|uniref:RRM domain-containing protein n=1 Tax=Halobacteriovorax marinus TaxID=97084 RepID=A0A1Y5FE57_9BACT|nr:hypothetical protein A9Q84_11130 [Halobacteriovorax marinus]